MAEAKAVLLVWSVALFLAGWALRDLTKREQAIVVKHEMESKEVEGYAVEDDDSTIGMTD